MTIIVLTNDYDRQRSVGVVCCMQYTVCCMLYTVCCMVLHANTGDTLLLPLLLPLGWSIDPFGMSSTQAVLQALQGMFIKYWNISVYIQSMFSVKVFAILTSPPTAALPRHGGVVLHPCHRLHRGRNETQPKPWVCMAWFLRPPGEGLWDLRTRLRIVLLHVREPSYTPCIHCIHLHYNMYTCVHPLYMYIHHIYTSKHPINTL